MESWRVWRRFRIQPVCVGAECRALDIAFFLKLVGCDKEGDGEHSLSHARRKPEIVRNSAIEFSKARYAVDVLKVEIPVALDYVEGTRPFRGVEAYDRSEALQHFREAAAGTSLPFIYLSAGVSNSVFVESLELAEESRVSYSGVLCGRATWKDGIATYAQQGSEAFKEWLLVEEVQNIERVNAMLKAATPLSKRLHSPHN